MTCSWRRWRKTLRTAAVIRARQAAASGDGDDEEEGVIVLKSDYTYLPMLLTGLAALHSIVAVIRLFAYYRLKVLLQLSIVTENPCDSVTSTVSTWFIRLKHCSIHRTIDWLIDCSNIRSIVCSIDWLIDWLTRRLTNRLIDWLIDWLRDVQIFLLLPPQVPLEIFKLEKEIARKVEFEGMFIEEPPEDLWWKWCKIVISAR